MPDFSELERTPEPDWAYSVYGNVTEEIPSDIPEPLGKEVVLWAHVDANLYHCMVTGRACSALLLWANQTLIDWGASLQTTVEVATYGSEFAAGRRATEQNIVLRKKVSLPRSTNRRTHSHLRRQQVGSEQQRSGQCETAQTAHDVVVPQSTGSYRCWDTDISLHPRESKPC